MGVPADGTPQRSRRWVGLLVAAAAAVVGAVLAPSAWVAGTGTLHVHVDDAEVAWEVSVGTTEPVALDGRVGPRDVEVTLPAGVPVDAPVEVRVATGGPTVVPSAIEVALDLPDGRVTPVPVLRRDPADGALVAVRRPPVHAATALALLGAAVVLWVTTALPLFATALLIPVVLAAGGVTDPVAALAPFANPIIALFLGGFLLAEAMRRVELDRWAAARLVGLAGARPRRLFAALLATSAFLSMWMSNTAAVAVLLPVALAVATPVDDPAYTRVLVLGTAWAATLGGVGSAIGTPANLLAIEFLETFDVRTITFAGWFAYGLPMVVLLLPVLAVVLWWGRGIAVRPAALREVGRALADAAPGPLGRDRARVLGIFVLVATTWLLESWHGVHPGIVALGAVVVLAVTGDVRGDDLATINWSALLTFGGGLALGTALTVTGVADTVAAALGSLSRLPEPLAVGAVATVTLLLTTVASNTASAATLVPLAIPLAAVLGVDVTQLVVVVAIASSIDFALFIGTPPTMLAYATGLFTPGEILRRGAWLDLLGLVVLVTLVPLVWRGLGVG